MVRNVLTLKVKQKRMTQGLGRDDHRLWLLSPSKLQITCTFSLSYFFHSRDKKLEVRLLLIIYILKKILWHTLISVIEIGIKILRASLRQSLIFEISMNNTYLYYMSDPRQSTVGRTKLTDKNIFVSGLKNERTSTTDSLLFEASNKKQNSLQKVFFSRWRFLQVNVLLKRDTEHLN